MSFTRYCYSFGDYSSFLIVFHHKNIFPFQWIKPEPSCNSLDSEQEGSTYLNLKDVNGIINRPYFADEHELMELLEGDKAYDLIYTVSEINNSSVLLMVAGVKKTHCDKGKLNGF